MSEEAGLEARELLKGRCGLTSRQRLDDPRLDGISEIKTYWALQAIGDALRLRDEARAQAIEEAAKLVRAHANLWFDEDVVGMLARLEAAIRALKTPAGEDR